MMSTYGRSADRNKPWNRTTLKNVVVQIECLTHG